jgi:hypothetical protein
MRLCAKRFEKLTARSGMFTQMPAATTLLFKR